MTDAVCRNYGICTDCHFFESERATVPLSNGKVFPCVSVLSSGWMFWRDNQKAPAECDDYVQKGKYHPDETWGAVKSILENL